MLGTHACFCRHESTVSRAMRGKYLQCSWGVFPLNYFLTASVSRKAGNPSGQTPAQMKEAIRKIILTENKEKPFSDRLIAEELEKNGLHLSREASPFLIAEAMVLLSIYSLAAGSI